MLTYCGAAAWCVWVLGGAEKRIERGSEWSSFMKVFALGKMWEVGCYPWSQILELPAGSSTINHLIESKLRLGSAVDVMSSFSYIQTSGS